MPFLIYYKEVMAELKLQNPGFLQRDIAKLAGKGWSCLSEEDKSKYKLIA